MILATSPFAWLLLTSILNSTPLLRNKWKSWFTGRVLHLILNTSTCEYSFAVGNVCVTFIFYAIRWFIFPCIYTSFPPDAWMVFFLNALIYVAWSVYDNCLMYFKRLFTCIGTVCYTELLLGDLGIEYVILLPQFYFISLPAISAFYASILVTVPRNPLQKKLGSNSFLDIWH